jgi:hypothetical protein
MYLSSGDKWQFTSEQKLFKATDVAIPEDIFPNGAGMDTYLF